jgi:hypothetical protein
MCAGALLVRGACAALKVQPRSGSGAFGFDFAIRQGTVCEFSGGQRMESLTPSRIPYVVHHQNARLGTGEPKSVGQRWATLVLKLCSSPDDLKTLKDWARFAGISYSSLCECCRLVGVRPHDARDFARALRALMQSATLQCQPYVLLDISDRRTLKSFLARAGSPFLPENGASSISEFMAQQQFIPVENEGLKLLIRRFPDEEDMNGIAGATAARDHYV